MDYDVICKTNLDLRHEVWPSKFRGIPRVGDRVESLTVHDNGFRLTLEVVSVAWKASTEYTHGAGMVVIESHGSYPVIELHDPMKRSIVDFYEWYAPLVGTSVSSFI